MSKSPGVSRIKSAVNLRKTDGSVSNKWLLQCSKVPILIFNGILTTTLYYEGWEFFTPGEGHFNMLASGLLTMIVMLPGVAITKLGEYFERKKQARAPHMIAA
jgi:hypothetical protein